jgi:hypothetical protein
MILPVTLDALPYAVGTFVARMMQWSPLGKRVILRIEDSGDRLLVGRRIAGIVRAFDGDAIGTPLLIQLHDAVRIEGRHNRHVEFVVATAALCWHGPSRLLLTWAVVRMTDAPSFVDHTFQRTIGIGRLTLHSGLRRNR